MPVHAGPKMRPLPRAADKSLAQIDNSYGKTKHVSCLSPVPVAARSKAWVCGSSPAEIVGSNPTECMDVCLL